MANCLAAAREFHQTGPLETRSTVGPSNHQNCVELRNRNRFLVKNTDKLGSPEDGHNVNTLLEQCLDNPTAPRVAGITILAPHAASSNGGKLERDISLI